jgi:hypothetical protein
VFTFLIEAHLYNDAANQGSNNMKKALLFLTCLSLQFLNNSAFAGEPEGCPIKRDEELVCSMLLCSVGLLIDESRPKCLKIQREYAIYLATLGFWDKPPKCKSRDMDCNKTGKASKAPIPPDICTDPVTMETDAECVKGKNIADFDCDDIKEVDLQNECFVNLAKINNACDELSGEEKDKCLGVEPEPETVEEPVEPETVTAP